MKMPPFSLPSLPAVLSPLKALPVLKPVLKMGLADLARARRAWPSVLPGACDGNWRARTEAGALEEVASFGSNPGALRMLRFVPPGLPHGAPLGGGAARLHPDRRRV